MLQNFAKKIGYDDPIEVYASRLEALLQGTYPLSRRAVALLLLQNDEEMSLLMREKEKERADRIVAVVEEAKKAHTQPLIYSISVQRQKEATRITHVVMAQKEGIKKGLRERLGLLFMEPLIGAPLLLAILYYGLYKFVGGFGAGVLVDFLEGHIFIAHVNPFATALVHAAIPSALLQDLLVGDYGIITLGARYAFAIILPIVATFFFAFAIVEDSGYLPRLAMLVDRMFKKIGLSGRAVIPLVLGFGCDTMATLVARTLPTKRERIIATLLLALAVPCSAQMGVILGLLGGNTAGLFVWLGVIMIVFLFVGYLSAQIMPGERPSFYMEIPPLRFPHIGNIVRKTWTRLEWYFFEILPLFIIASVLIWVGQITGVFDRLVKLLAYPVSWIGLPREAAVSFLFGFFRRDYGAAGLYDLKKAGLLSGNQLVVAAITLTLFLPCVAQLIMNVKERGLRVGIAMSTFILFFSFSVGYAVNMILLFFGIRL